MEQIGSGHGSEESHSITQEEVFHGRMSGSTLADADGAGSTRDGRLRPLGGIVESSQARESLVPEPLTHPVKIRDHLSISISLPIVLLLDLVTPCLIYYIWLDSQRSQWQTACQPYHDRTQPCPVSRPVPYDKHILGLSIVAFGIGEAYVLLARCVRLFRHRAMCGPLLSDRKWEMDATAWVYGSALLVALIPFVVSTSVGNGIPWLFLYAPGFLFAYLGLWAIATLFRFTLPVRVDSDPAGTRVRPLVFYAAEDFMAVDGWQGREFRKKYRARYETSSMFRRMILELTVFWIAGCMIYLGCVSAMIWTLPFEYAFGATLGFLFGWLILWAFSTWLWIQIALRREKRVMSTKSMS